MCLFVYDFVRTHSATKSVVLCGEEKTERIHLLDILSEQKMKHFPFFFVCGGG